MITNELVFNGFSNETLAFFAELKANNNKDWFTENKPRYERIKNLSKELVSLMALRFSTLGLPYISNPSASLFRIYRDVRFSKNKDPYKTNLGIFFPYSPEPLRVKATMLPGLYMHIEDSGSFIAGGIHMPMPQELKSCRSYISANYDELSSIINKTDFKSLYDNILTGESLTKVPKGFAADDPAANILKLKEFTVSKTLDHSELLSSGLPDLLEYHGKTMAPFLNFLYEGMHQE